MFVFRSPCNSPTSFLFWLFPISSLKYLFWRTVLKSLQFSRCNLWSKFPISLSSIHFLDELDFLKNHLTSFFFFILFSCLHITIFFYLAQITNSNHGTFYKLRLRSGLLAGSRSSLDTGFKLSRVGFADCSLSELRTVYLVFKDKSRRWS